MRNKVLLFVGAVLFLFLMSRSGFAAILFGKITDQSSHPVANAKVVLVNAADAGNINSLSPVEDLANEAAVKGYLWTLSNAEGNYKFENVPAVRVFPFVIPAKNDTIHLPGGNKSRVSIVIKGSKRLNIEITTFPSSKAHYVGSSKCLSCHRRVSAKYTLLFLGLRKPGQLSGLQKTGLSGSYHDAEITNRKMLNKFKNPAEWIKLSGYGAWLGHDKSGYYFQLAESKTAVRTEKYKIDFTYGGDTKNWKAVFITTTGKNGRPEPLHGKNSDGSYAYLQIAPFAYFVAKDKIVPYSESVKNWFYGGFKGNRYESFDLKCAGCHGATGIEKDNEGNLVVKFVPDQSGYTLDDGTTNRYDINVGCEKCHGPGSEHLKHHARGIIKPSDLPAGRFRLVCGRCHQRGIGKGIIDGTHTTGSIASSGNLLNGGSIKFAPSGISPAEFYGTKNGTGILPFEGVAKTGHGYFTPINMNSDPHSWQDRKFGTKFNHSKGNYQQYLDFARSGMAKNDRMLVVCADCHNDHKATNDHQLRFNEKNNRLCLTCHNGDILPNTKTVFDSLTLNEIKRFSKSDIKKIAIAVKKHMAKRASPVMGMMYDPLITKMGRCTSCHMPKTAKSAEFKIQKNGFIVGDIHSHTFDVMGFMPIMKMKAKYGKIGVTPNGYTNSCGVCHHGTK
ncbi:MAG: hypothetical protein GXP60_04960 [Epsilonproteobacteria bacterium]|nr:hypothetical protein [Campylobacterota bacterium]